MTVSRENHRYAKTCAVCRWNGTATCPLAKECKYIIVPDQIRGAGLGAWQIGPWWQVANSDEKAEGRRG